MIYSLFVWTYVPVLNVTVIYCYWIMLFTACVDYSILHVISAYVVYGLCTRARVPMFGILTISALPNKGYHA